MGRETTIQRHENQALNNEGLVLTKFLLFWGNFIRKEKVALKNTFVGKECNQCFYSVSKVTKVILLLKLKLLIVLSRLREH